MRIANIPGKPQGTLLPVQGHTNPMSAHWFLQRRMARVASAPRYNTTGTRLLSASQRRQEDQMLRVCKVIAKIIGVKKIIGVNKLFYRSKVCFTPISTKVPQQTRHGTNRQQK